jgi:DNA-binding CsgD family transcriptional regulator
VPFAPSKSGFLLLDSSLNVVASNPEALQILSYPNKPDRIKQPGLFLSDRIRTGLLDNQSSSDGSRILKEYYSGKRHYVCRGFQVDCNGRFSGQPAIAVLLERNVPPDLALEELCRQFDLTPRERETVELLVQGLTTKEIANRLDISPNTVKAFVRLVMVKMSVSTRSGIVGRLTGSRAFS